MPQNTSSAVMQQRIEPPSALDFFPTPPWGTRALLEHVIHVDPSETAWEPACGGGHMSNVLTEYFSDVWASDVHDYGWGHAVGSFVGEGADVAVCPWSPDWVITNPPFALAEEFVIRALKVAGRGVAMLVRSAWMEGVGRYENIFSPLPPTIVAPFVERVPMVKGRWDPKASTATSYAWFCWHKATMGRTTVLGWIPPGQRRVLHRPHDLEMAG